MKRANIPPTSGFSLLEILIVLAIIGFLAAVTVPMVTSGIAGTQLKTSARKTAAIFRYARNEAVARKKLYWVVVDREENWIAVMDRPLNAPEGEDRFEKQGVSDNSHAKLYEYPEEVVIADVIIEEDMSIDTQGAIIFFPNGSCSGGKIVLQIDESRAYTVELDSITGMAAIEDGALDAG